MTLYSSDLESHKPSTESSRWSMIGSIDGGGALLGQGVYLGVRHPDLELERKHTKGTH